MRNRIRGRLLAGILAAALLCTGIPKTAYAVEQAKETVLLSFEDLEETGGERLQTEIPEDEKTSGDGENPQNETDTQGETDTQDEKNPADQEVSDEDTPSGDADEAGEQEAEAPSDENVEETQEEELQTEVSEEEEGLAEKEVSAKGEMVEAFGETALYAANAGNSGYPYNVAAGTYIADKWNFYQCECTSFVAYCLNEKNGFSFWNTMYGSTADKKWGNANHWKYVAQQKGFTVDSNPAVGAVAWTGSGANGHVAWVSAVNGNKVTIEEYNNGWVKINGEYHGNHKYGTRTEDKSAFQYIHIKDMPVIPQDHGGRWDEGYYPVIPDGDYHIVSALGDKWWLTIAGNSMENGDKGGNVQLWEYNDMDNPDHIFHFEFIPDGYGIGRGFYKVTNKHSGKCLDSEGGHEYLYNQQTGKRTNVHQWTAHGGAAQQWAILNIDGGEKGTLYTFTARCSGYAIDVEDAIAASGTNISMWKYHGGPAQQWRLIPWVPSLGRTMEDGEYQIVPFSADDKVVSVAGDDPKNGTNVELNSHKGDYRHTFDVKYEGDGYYSIVNKDSGLSLDVEGGPNARGTRLNIQLWKRDKTSSAQKWVIRDRGDGYWNVISKSSGMYLDVQGGGEKDGCNIGLYEGADENTYLKFKFVPYQRQKLDPPTADIPSGTGVEAGTGVSLSCGVEGAAIYYTLDGTEPTRQSTLYTAPIAVTENVTVKAVAVKEGDMDSDVAVFTYTVKPDVPNIPDTPDIPDVPDTSDTPEEPEQPEGNVPKEDIPSDGIIPDGLWIAGLAEDGYYYTGKAVRPEVRVYDHRTLLKEKTDYTISYKNNTNAYGYDVSDPAFRAGKAPAITVTGRGNYTGRETQNFKILAQDIGSPAFAADDMTIACKKSAQKPVPTLLWQNKKLRNQTDFTVVYYSGKDRVDSVQEAGRYDIEIVGKGNFGGTRRIGLTVTKDLKLMSKMTVERIKAQAYTGDAITPVLTVKDGRTKLTEGEHYTVSYSQNTAAGTAYAVVTGIEEAGYGGTKRVSFQITGTPISRAVVTGLTGKEFVYGGVELEPELDLCIKGKRDGVFTESALTPGIDYTTVWQKNRDAGTATVIFTGKGAYTGALKKTFRIKPFDVSVNAEGRFEAKLPQSAVPYAKGGAKPEVTVTFRQSNGITQTLTEGKDYTLSYKNNTAVNGGGDSQKLPTVTVKGKGSFKGTYGAKLPYQITARDIGELTLAAADRTYQNKKNAFATKVTVTDLDGRVLGAGKDYEKTFAYVYKEETTVKNGTAADSGKVVRAAKAAVEPGDIIPVGTILRVTVSAREGGNYTGTIAGEYRITRAAISSASVSIPKQTYTGRPIEFEKNQITVRIKKETVDPSQYEIVPGSYKNNVKKGTASVTIRGVDNYGGTKTVKFAIRARGFAWWWK